MIQINRINQKDRKELHDIFYRKVRDKIEPDIVNDILLLLKIDFRYVMNKNEFYKAIIFGNYNTLFKIKVNKFRDYSLFFQTGCTEFKYKNLRTEWQIYISLYKDVLQTQKDNKKLGNIIVDKLNVYSCPYCNRSYIDSRGDMTPTVQMDHFFSKIKYPIFALSLYNWIPSCYACNHIKSDQDLLVSPYDTHILQESLVKFTTLPNTMHYDEDFVIEIVKKVGTDIKADHLLKDIRNLKIDFGYANDIDYVRNLYKQGIIYTDLYKQDLLAKYPQLFSSMKEVNECIYGKCLDVMELNKTPMSKLTRDILVEMKIIPDI